MEPNETLTEQTCRQEEPRFTVVTQMETKDLRRFLYTATFLGNPLTLPLVAVICGVGAAIVAMGKGLAAMFSLWVIYVLLATAFVCCQVEWRNRARTKSSPDGKVGPDQELRFYGEDMVIDQVELGAHSEVRYDQIHQILEQKRYFIVFYTKTMATLIRKEDMGGETARQLSLFLKEKLGGRMRQL